MHLAPGQSQTVLAASAGWPGMKKGDSTVMQQQGRECVRVTHTHTVASSGQLCNSSIPLCPGIPLWPLMVSVTFLPRPPPPLLCL